jgi:hypothetical protein
MFYFWAILAVVLIGSVASILLEYSTGSRPQPQVHEQQPERDRTGIFLLVFGLVVLAACATPIAWLWFTA